MLPSPHIATCIDQLILTCTEAVPSKPKTPIRSLPAQWLDMKVGTDRPEWIDIAQHLFCGHWSKKDIRTVLLCANQIRRGQRPGGFFGISGQSVDIADPRRDYEPEQIVRLAAHANGWEEAEFAMAPCTLQDRHLQVDLMHAQGARSFGPALGEKLELTQMLVYGTGLKLRGRLLSLRLQAVDSTPEKSDLSDRPDTGRLIAGPSTCLLWTDALFHQGLQQVQTMLDSVLLPGAPAIAWDIDVLPLDGDAVQSLSALEGPSATAAIAYAALYLLRGHLDNSQAHVAEMAKLLYSIEDPQSVSVTAALLPNLDPSQPWPRLDGVGGVPEKLAALEMQLPFGRRVAHRFVAKNQKSDAPIQATPATDLGHLIEEIVRLTCTLDSDALALNQALQTSSSDAAIAADPALQRAMERLRSKALPGTGVRAHLIWRYAKLCAGQPSPFGDVAQLGQHFVSLSVNGPKGHGTDDDRNEREESAQRNAEDPLICDNLFDILSPAEPQHIARWGAVPAWCIQARPFSGKTTLIQRWELSRLRAALHEQALGQGWGEVPVFLPMSAFMRQSPLSQPSADDLGRALRAYAQRLAPALPWSELLPEEPPTPEKLNAPRPDGLRIRLCIDALNEYRTGQANEGSAIGKLCDWLALRCDPDRPGALLPPVFSVRREEAANFELSAESNRDWRAHAITVHAWRPSQMRAYVIQRGLPPAVQSRLLQALDLPGPEADNDALNTADTQGLTNALAKFSQVPGFLSAQCTLLQRWPHLPISGRRAHIMLALAWHGLDKWQRSSDFNDLQYRANTDPALAALLGWLMPDSAREQLQYMSKGHGLVLEWEPGLAGGLLEGLGRVADAMQDPEGNEPEESALWPTHNGRNGLRATLSTEWPQVLGGDMPEQWLAQAVASGLVLKTLQQERPNSRALPWLGFAHQQIQEFFSALSVAPDKLPDLTAPAFKVATQDLDDHLRKEGSKLELPAVTPHTERLLYAADLATPQGAERLIEAVLQQGNLALAAQLAIDQRARLERPDDDSGRVVSHGFWFPERRSPLLQHIRARLLLASVDTGAATLPKLHASGILAGIADIVEQLRERWQSQWAPLLPALRDPVAAPPHQNAATGWPAPLTTGVDLRQRLQYGLLLGQLGDNIRYERVSAEVEGQERTGIRLKAAHWALIPDSGPGVVHRIGSDREADKGKKYHPAWTVPDGELPPTLFAHTPAVVMQWQVFWEDPLAEGKPRWQPRRLSDERFANPLQPITAIDWFAAQAFTAWSAPLHLALVDRLPQAAPEVRPPRLGLPTEVQHEAAVRFHPAQPRPTVHGWWLHDAADRSAPSDWQQPSVLPPTLFNHRHTRWGSPAPVGVFSAALSPIGIEAMGNAWTWCSNQYTKNYLGDNARRANSAATVKAVEAAKNSPLALRCGSFSLTADFALAAYRGHYRPDRGISDLGLRWQMSRPIF